MPRRLLRLSLLLASAFSLTACTWIKAKVNPPTPPPHMLTAYFDDDFRFWKGSGTASIGGQAAIKLDDGRILNCTTVTLLPATQYNTELEQALALGTGYPFDYNRKAHLHNREGACDPAGHFQFDAIPAGVKWIVLTRLTWKDMTPESTWSAILPETSSPTGGYLFQETMARDGLNKLTLSNADFVQDKN